MTYHTDKDRLSALMRDYKSLNDEGRDTLLVYSSMLSAVARNTGKYRPGVISIEYARRKAAERGGAMRE